MTDTADPVSAHDAVPTLYSWIGGMPAIARLLGRFYDQVHQDEVLAPVFEHMSPEHANHVAVFIGEVLGGPPTYSADLGGHGNMIRKHANRALTEGQRQRWVQMLLRCADELGVPSDPEFRSALVSYLEWGTRLAVINSQPGADLSGDAAMPRWGWGEVKGPFLK